MLGAGAGVVCDVVSAVAGLVGTGADVWAADAWAAGVTPAAAAAAISWSTGVDGLFEIWLEVASAEASWAGAAGAGAGVEAGCATGAEALRAAATTWATVCAASVEG